MTKAKPSSTYGKHFSATATLQSQPILGTAQVANSAGGYAWAVDDWTRLDRFLLLGNEGGSYYASEQSLTRENAGAVLACLKADGLRVVNKIMTISESGRAPKNGPALFALAMAAGLGNDVTKRAALSVLPRVARTGTHLFTFLEDVQEFRGWGRGLRNAVGRWYTAKDPADLALQVVKYRNRNGWTHADALRLAHPMPLTEEMTLTFKWVVDGDVPSGAAHELLHAWANVQKVTTPAAAAAIISKNPALTWEMIPSPLLGSSEVWEALLPNLPMTAMIRNLARMTANGLLAPFSDAVKIVTARLLEASRLHAARVHPILVLLALATYRNGAGLKGGLSWNPVPQVIDALNEAFYLAFALVDSTSKNVLLALDVSGSMSVGDVAGTPLTPREAAAAMAMVTARTEPNYAIIAFGEKLMPLDISPHDRLDAVLAKTRGLPFGRTDCAQPMLYALKHKLPVDAFLTYTDSETWAGNVHPAQALTRFRREMDKPRAKSVVVGMVANAFTIADPNDGGSMDVVGFDAAAPAAIADFVRN